MGKSGIRFRFLKPPSGRTLTPVFGSLRFNKVPWCFPYCCKAYQGCFLKNPFLKTISRDFYAHTISELKNSCPYPLMWGTYHLVAKLHRKSLAEHFISLKIYGTYTLLGPVTLLSAIQLNCSPVSAHLYCQATELR